MGAAGRDFHNFNCVFREDPDSEVIAFTATQIPDIEGRCYPAELAGKLYPEGIPILEEASLPTLIKEHKVDEVIFAYSDVSHDYVMNRCSLVNACGADFRILGPALTSLKASRPMISVCATRTGCGKSQTTRYLYDLLREMGKSVTAIRHPMPYGDLAAQAVQRFAELKDMEEHKCTIEEMEEYEPHIAAGHVIYAGVDYGAILKTLEERDNPDLILFDGGNNDTSFYASDLKIVVADPLRAGHEISYHPGETNLRMADVIVINKVDSASREQLRTLRENIEEYAGDALVVEAESELSLDGDISGKRVLVVEDGPTLTHGGMKIGAGSVAAMRFGASEIVDPRPNAVGKIAATYEIYPEIGEGILPAMGYSDEQRRDLEETINATEADLVLSGTPINLGRILKLNKPIIRVGYDLKPVDGYEDILPSQLRRLFS